MSIHDVHGVFKVGDKVRFERIDEGIYYGEVVEVYESGRIRVHHPTKRWGGPYTEFARDILGYYKMRKVTKLDKALA